MQHVRGHDRVKGRIWRRKLAAIVLPVINRRFRGIRDVYSGYGCSQHRRKMMRDKSIAATDVKHFRAPRDYTRDLQSHIVSAANLSSPALAQPTALYAITGSC